MEKSVRSVLLCRVPSTTPRVPGETHSSRKRTGDTVQMGARTISLYYWTGVVTRSTARSGSWWVPLAWKIRFLKLYLRPDVAVPLGDSRDSLCFQNHAGQDSDILPTV